MSSGEESNREEELAVVNLENVKRISETYQPRKGRGKHKKGTIPKSVVQEIWKDRLSPRFYSRLMSVMFPEDSNEVSFLSFYTIYKNLAEPETEIMFRALTIYHIATIHEPPFNYETANEYPNASYKAIKDYVCDVITSYLHAIINVNMKEAHAWLSLRASNTLIDGNLAAAYVLKDLETHRNEVSIGSLEIWLEKSEIYYTVSEQLYLFLFGVNNYTNVKPLIPFPFVQTTKVNKTLLALPDVLLLNSKLRKRAQRWTLAYMLDRHSQNWEALKQAIYGKGPTIIVIQDANGDIFGMYGSHRWIPTEGFFGNDECFLFTLKPDVNIYEGSGRDNNYQLFNESGIGMGGTEDKPGLFIQSDTVKGKTSLACRTFREFWPLARELEFKICRMEIWTVQLDEGKTAVFEDGVEELICSTQYMRMRGDEVYETKKPDPPRQLRVEQDSIRNTSEKQRARCYGECAMDKSQPNSDGRSQRVCCSKKCPKRMKVGRREQNGEGDGNMRVCAMQKFPGQEEEKHQRHRKYSDEEVKMKIDSGKRFRKSFEARQKHGAAGFIHPSLAAEENERNAKEAAEAKRNAKELAEETEKKYTNRTKASTKRRLSNEQDLSQKSYPPSYNLTSDFQTQVGESRLMKPTCRSYRHSNKCSCSVKTSCACPTKDSVSPTSPNDTTYMVPPSTTSNRAIRETKPIYHNDQSETKQKIKKTNGLRSNPKPQNNSTMEKDTDANAANGKLAPTEYCTTDMIFPSSSSVLIEIKRSDMDIKGSNAEPKTENQTQPSKSKNPAKAEKEKPPKKGDRDAMVKIKGDFPIVRSDASSKHTKTEVPRKERQKDIKTHSTHKQVEEKTKTQDPLQDVLSQLDCHCSSESGIEDDQRKKCDTASKCCCQTRASNYLTKTNKTVITDASLSDISSSICSCILDHKNKITERSAASSARETQNLTRSRRKSDGSAHSGTCCKSFEKNTRSPVYKKETQQHLKSKKVSRTSADPLFLSEENPKPIPPTCLRCKTLVGQNGCQCKSNSTRKTTARETQNLNTSRRYSNWSTASETVSSPERKYHQFVEEKEAIKNSALKTGSRRSVVLSSPPVQDWKTDLDSASLIEETSSRYLNFDRTSSQFSKIVPKKACQASCKCSLSPSYFPVFPEDLIKEGNTDCDCASYNDLRFPVIVETPTDISREPSVKSPLPEPDKPEPEEPQEPEQKLKKCGCAEDDNTIIILNVSKCDTAETVEKLIHDMEDKAGEPKIKSLLFKCKDLTDNKASPCSTKSEAERIVLRQHIEKLIRKKNPQLPLVAPQGCNLIFPHDEQEEHPHE